MPFRFGRKPATLVLGLALAAAAFAQTIDIDIPYEKFVLDNGLTVIVHEDRKAPIVAVNIWYHVGSKNEKPGKTGFAHLFEHLMFNGSENFNHDYFKALEKVGATDLNGTTSNDRTNYFQNVPTPALDLALWMESDRMGHLLGVVDQGKLDEQRGVVQNEKRQGENQPYGLAYDIITRATYPAGHPYSWTVIGSMEDLNAATLDDVREWFKTYYGPNNAVLVLAGDIDVKTAKEKVQKYFGHIPASPPIPKHRTWIAKRTESSRQVMQDRVPQARLYKVWNTPEWAAADTDYLDFVSDILAQGKTSRLYKRLVYEDQIATSANAYIAPSEIAGQFAIIVTAKPGVSLETIEKAVNEELEKFLKSGPTDAELQRVKTQYLANFLRGIERIGGFGGKSDLLATNQTYTGDPGFYKISLKRKQESTKEDIRMAAVRWLSEGDFNLEVHPFPEFKTVAASADRSKLPDVGTPPDLKMPRLQRATLSNGLKVVLAERHEIPIVNFNLMLDAGYAADQFAIPGTANLAMQMLDEGTLTRNSLQISEELDNLGARLSTGSSLDISNVSLSAVKIKLDPSLEIFADVILNPAFPESEFKRLQQQQLAAIQREKASPTQAGLRVLPALLYGSGHAYGNPFSGSGTEDSVRKMTVADMKKFHEAWFKPNNATLVIVGDTTMAEITPKLERLFSKWQRGDVPKKNIANVALRPKSSVYLIDKPGSIQSVILAGQVAPPKVNPDEIAIETMNAILGGMFLSRVNMNLREDKHWSYGARTYLLPARGQRPFAVLAPVQTDKTKESIVEVDKEIRGILKDRPVNEEEMNLAQDSLTLRLPGSQETTNQLGGALAEIVRYGLPDDHFQTYQGKVRALKREDVNAAAERVLRPDNLVWVIVGDRSKIEAGIRELNLGDLTVIDADGNPVQ
ncbi:MAG: M16 family metallopeptidase [Bryobacteraceae bacterium]